MTPSPAGPGLVPARFGKALRLAAGQTLKVINLHGTQVVDTWAFNTANPGEHLSMEHTRSLNSCITLAVGNYGMSNHRRPMLCMVEDTSPGIHDTLLCACNRYLYEELGCTEYHRNCEDNLHEALSELGLAIPFTPAPLNIFMNVPVLPDRSLTRLVPETKPGDFVRLRAQMDVIIALSACPQDITTINGNKTPRDVHYVVED
jgi:uncharacterized protein YcgI (DUF1989 family)